MARIGISDRFERSFDRIRDRRVRDAILAKIRQLEQHAPLGKKLAGNPYWSLRVGRYRVIYELRDSEIRILLLLEREHGYREL